MSKFLLECWLSSALLAWWAAPQHTHSTISDSEQMVRMIHFYLYQYTAAKGRMISFFFCSLYNWYINILPDI